MIATAVTPRPYTVAYHTETGTAWWMSRYDNGRNDHGTALAVDRLRLRVFGTGNNRDTRNVMKYATIANGVIELALAEAALGLLRLE